MTNRDRLFAALNGEPTDHVPVWLLFPYHETDYYVDVRTHPKYRPVFEASKDYAIILNRRNLGASPHAPTFARRNMGIPLFAPGVEYRHEEERTPDCLLERDSLHYKGKILNEEMRMQNGRKTRRLLLDNAEDLEVFCSLPVETDRNRLAASLEHRLTQYLREKDEFPKKHGSMMLDLGEPIVPLYLAANQQQYAIWSITHQDMIVNFLDRVMERMRIIYEWCLERELAEIYFLVGSELASPPLVSPETFRRWVLPYAKEIIEKVHRRGQKVIVHYHGQIRDILPDFVEMNPDGLHTIESPPGGNCTLSEAYSVVHDHITLIGNIQHEEFRTRTEDEFAEIVRDVLNECRGKRFILSPSCGPYEEDVADTVISNCMVLMKTAWEYDWS